MNGGTIENPDSTFGKMAHRLSAVGFVQFIKFNLAPRYPRLFKLLGIELLDMKSVNFFESIIQQSLASRRDSNVKRNDFQQLLIEPQKGELKAVGPDDLSSFEKEASLDSSGKAKQLVVTDDVIIAQSFLFFFAGFSSISSFISFAAYELAANQDIQERLQKEIDSVVKNDGALDYDELCELVYLDMVVCEILRLYPATLRLERMCLRDYHDPESGLFLPKDSVVCFPVNAIHKDPNYYPNPETFDPENFSPEKKATRSPYAFLYHLG